VGVRAVTAVNLFLWFGVGLAVLNIVGMGEVAASLGTASGFIGIGVVFTLKEMIADTVVGIDLRNTRIRTEDGDLIVLANRSVEQKWTRVAGSGEPGSGSHEG
jgi:small-conductance mechanosensitive channel